MSEKCPKCGAGFTRRPFSRKGWKYCDCGRRFHPVHGWETWENVTCLGRQLAKAQEKLAFAENQVKEAYERINNNLEKLADQQAIIDRLPKTADGVPVVPGMNMFVFDGLGRFHELRTGHSMELFGWGPPIQATPSVTKNYYSTRAAAEASALAARKDADAEARGE